MTALRASDRLPLRPRGPCLPYPLGETLDKPRRSLSTSQIWPTLVPGP
ncbi:hypothetical protein DBR06_SOUSAS45410005, partial [Sousa chinensis]